MTCSSDFNENGLNDALRWKPSFEMHFDPDIYKALTAGIPKVNEKDWLTFTWPDGTVTKGTGTIMFDKYEERPASRWQRFKQCWFPKWLLRWFPIKMVIEATYKVENWRAK